jgi:transmembrane sensor
MSEKRISNPAAQSLAEAAGWRIRLTELELASTPEFEIWLAQPENEAAWKQVSAPWDFLGAQKNAPELAKARQAALDDAKRAGQEQGAPRHGRRLVLAFAATLVLGLVGWAGLSWLEAPDDYTTALGERRVVTLVDGSRIALDANSEVTVRYTKSARLLELLHGQARFDVAHDVERPFSVLAGAQKIIATGTAFNIDLNGPRVLVTLIEGHVVVVDEKSTVHAMGVPEPVALHQSVELKAGQQLTASPEAAPVVETANVQRATAWMNGQIMIDNEPLSQVIAQVNRYTAAPIQIRDPEVGAMRISGVFNTGDVAGVLDIVTHYLPVRAVGESDGTIVLEKKAKG